MREPVVEGVKLYYWHGGLLLLAKSLVLHRPTTSIAATLRIALREPYTIDVDGQRLSTRASIVAPKSRRASVEARDSDMALFYLPIERPEYGGLRRRLGNESVVELELDDFSPVLPKLQQAFDGKLAGSDVKALAYETLGILVGSNTEIAPMDPRIVRSCEILATLPLNEFNIEAIAQQVNLSSSRLRSLFKQTIGHSIGEYARWSAVWQALGQYTQGRTFTDVAMDAGFFDLAHVSRNFVEVFGISPTLAVDSNVVERHYVP
ncbi:helix-turn-helix domain-containing protein [Zhongshania aquimaris]|uniref:AraC family transcriptional regulator n=1 Tax=Zhongshania aquimaris TaxID=2857107 RepID=A0ABS6VSS6_9GAMM|nr:AraC family transcriptional regulator [Zhongshania aquimaris]MBW2940781.1 AraC family transcriptional regulator [Zhongshania aquimaris]